MTNRSPAKLYVRLRKAVRVPPHRPVTLGQISRLSGSPSEEEKWGGMVVIPADAARGGERMVDILDIVRMIRETEPDTELEYVGEPQVLIRFAEPQKSPNRVYAVLAWLLLFTGSGLAIMNFHADVSMLEVHRKLYAYITGQEEAHPLLLQIPYSFGLGLGMVLFFNRVFKTRLNPEPDPLELEMYQYEDSIRNYRVDREIKNRRTEADDVE